MLLLHNFIIFIVEIRKTAYKFTINKIIYKIQQQKQSRKLQKYAKLSTNVLVSAFHTVCISRFHCATETCWKLISSFLFVTMYLFSKNILYKLNVSIIKKIINDFTYVIRFEFTFFASTKKRLPKNLPNQEYTDKKPKTASFSSFFFLCSSFFLFFFY